MLMIPGITPTLPDLTGVKNIIFDFGNILIDLDIPKTWRLLSDLAGDQYDSVMSVLNKNSVFEKFETGQLTDAQFILCIQAALPGEVPATAIKNAWNAMLLGIPAKRFEMLLHLRKNYCVCLLSNTNALHLEHVYRYLQFDLGITDFDTRYFDRTFYSHLVGLRKPDREIYEFVLKEIQAAPAQTLFIDDLAENLVAPAALGIHTYQHDPANEISDILLNGWCI
jgi:FMN phosphatase YigB (HAD superfamily)